MLLDGAVLPNSACCALFWPGLDWNTGPAE